MSILDSISENCIRKPAVTISDADVDGVLMTLRRQRIRWIPVKRPARLEDQVSITYSVTYKDKVIEINKTTPRLVVLGSGDFHKDMEQRSLVGARKGKNITLEVQIPREHTDTDLAGKPAVYNISVNEICRPVLPPLNTQFAKELGLSKGGAKTLHREVRAIMQREVDLMIKKIVRTQIIKILLADYRLEIDEQEILREINERKQAQTNTDQSVNPDTELLEPSEDQLRTLVKLSEIMKEIVRMEKIIIDTRRLNITVTAMALRADQPDKTAINYYNNFDELSRVEGEMLEDQVIECMLNYLKMKSVSMTYEEFKLALNSSWKVDDLSHWPIIQLRRDNKCEFCAPSKCCQYITQRLPTPRSKEDFRHLLWKISHEKIKIFKDNDGWNLLFKTPCTHLQTDGRCGIYESRPPVCSNYAVERCEFDGSAEVSWELCFNDYESFLSYCKKRFRSWEVI